MRCPVCGAELSLELAAVLDAEAPELADPLAPVVRRLEAERYGPPVHERGHHDEAQT